MAKWKPIETWKPKAVPSWPYLHAIVFAGTVTVRPVNLAEAWTAIG